MRVKCLVALVVNFGKLITSFLIVRVSDGLNGAVPLLLVVMNFFFRVVECFLLLCF